MRSVIVGTAGHIDHGKTSLVESLTGTNADRLPEERRRGITIDIGFAELRLADDVHLGFVDVPGHERFVRNMLAGAHGIDLVLLVVAADEGVMPQTREHFDICRLLGLRAGVICLTKLDAADAELRELVRAEVEELVAGSFLESAPVIETSARTGEGLDDLRAALLIAARAVPERAAGRVMRLPIDRAFTARGFGTIVTGTLVAGEVSAGDELELLPDGRPVRVRGVQVHNRSTDAAQAGERTAVNLGGVETSEVERGQVLAARARLRPTQIFDARLTLLPDAARALRSRARVRLHSGSGEFLARVRILEDAGAIDPGAEGYAQIRAESPLVVVHGDRFILRAYSPARTIGGGAVLDPFASKPRGRELAARRLRLNRLARGEEAGGAGELLAEFVRGAGERGLSAADAAARTGWTDERLREAVREAVERGAAAEADGVLVDREVLAGLVAAVVRAVAEHHRRDPLARGLGRETLRERVFAHAPPELFRLALAEAERAGELVAERDTVRLPTHTTELAGEDKRLADELEQLYRAAGAAPPAADEALARVFSAPGKERGRKLLRRLTESGALVLVASDLLMHRAALDDLIAATRGYAAGTPDRTIDVAAFKDLAGVSRKYAIPVLEYFDRERITRRAGDRRIVL